MSAHGCAHWHSAVSRFILPLQLVLIFIFFIAATPSGAAPVPLEGAASVTSGTCYADAVIIYNLASYLISNYAIHASAIPIGADIGRYTQRVTRQDGWLWNLWLTTISLFLPFFALARTLILVAQQLKSEGDGVLAALHHGALLVVVRDTDWKPGKSDQFVYTRLPHDFVKSDDARTGDQLPEATIDLDDEGEKHAFLRTDTDNHMLHGLAHPPPGYTLAVPERKGHTELLIKNHLKDTKRLKVHYRPGFMGVLLSLVQICVGSYNLYEARVTQIPRWGYAAYGLSVLPYVIMSILNLLCAAIVDSYACAQLLRTPILEESLWRPEGGDPEYDGTIGAVNPASMPQSSAIGQRGQGDYVAVLMRTETYTTNGHEQKILVVNALGEKPRTYRLIPSGRDVAKTEGNIAVGAEQAETRARPCGPNVQGGSTVHFTVSALSHNGPPPKSRVRELEEISHREGTTIACLFFIAMILPHVFIYALTGFRPNQSTVAQRGLMMAWLAADQFSSCSTLWCWIVWKKKHNVIPNVVQKAWYAVLMVAGMGGFVTVAQMYLQDNGYGFHGCSL
ncbi:uncharacterized protein B0H18DRAFT_1208267 [Fomitopsis serialis]|uniref:uncharacterized protein n=1 Tax=Fomitopsis serialis TaxID=139415 RepID=UPI0020074AD9|nr:uncharacterized protein B0H18DRAFT_1208267 [Neoantrodia serialis]KAH9932934.1 hypothetical protein B0H18DRAFT_1208267 [Neoantrodia serialis]